ncbi:MAG: HNH endonuclease [Pseudomonadota bacterium]
MTNRRRISETEREKIFDRDDGVCHWCGQPIDAGREPWDVEHVIPLELGGTEDKLDPNLRPIHRKGCHTAKTAQDRVKIGKAKRLVRRAKGIRRQARSAFPTNRDGRFKRKLNGEVVLREE